MESAQEFLRTLSLDEDTLSYLCGALDECVHLDMSEREEFLNNFLDGEDVAKLLALLPSLSQNTKTSKLTTDVIVRAVETEGMEQTEGTEQSAECAKSQSHETRALIAKAEKKSQSKATRTSRAKCELQEGAVRLDETLRFVDGYDDRCGAVGGFADDSFVRNAGLVQTGDHVLIKGRPCRVIQIKKGEKVWKGPHSGRFQSQIVARCIFTDRKFEHICPESQKVSMPGVSREKYTVIDIGDGGELTLLTATCATKVDLNLASETDADRQLAGSIVTAFNAGKTVVVTVLSACGIEKVAQFKALE